MTRAAHNLHPVNSPSIALSECGEKLHLHLPDDFCFGEGVDIPLNLEGLRLLRDMLDRHSTIVRARSARAQGRGFNGMTLDQANAVLEAFKNSGGQVMKVEPAPVLARIEREKRQAERPPSKAEKALADAGLSLNNITIRI